MYGQVLYYEPNRITLSLPINKSNYETTKTGDRPTKTDDKKEAIISYLKKNEVGKATEIAKLLGLKPTRTREILAEMINDEIVIPDGENKNRIYKLK